MPTQILAKTGFFSCYTPTFLWSSILYLGSHSLNYLLYGSLQKKYIDYCPRKTFKYFQLLSPSLLASNSTILIPFSTQSSLQSFLPQPPSPHVYHCLSTVIAWGNKPTCIEAQCPFSKLTAEQLQ